MASRRVHSKSAYRLDLGVYRRGTFVGGRFNTSIGKVFERSPIPTFIFHAESLRILAVNSAACSLYGYSREELLQRCSLDIRLEEEREAAKAAMLAFEETHVSPKYRTQIRADGAYLRVLTFAQRIILDQEDCVIEWNVDVTQREQSAVELKRTQIFLDAVVESIPSMVFVKDAYDGRFVLLNRAGETLLGLNRKDLIGKTDYDLFEAEEADRFRSADQAVVASGKLVTIENEPITTPSGIRSLRTQKVGVPDINGNPRYLLGISEDVTEKLKIEERSHHLALHDVLTDLPNRLLFQNVLDLELEAWRNGQGDFALLCLDLDRFKAVNDRLGHHAGDEVLRQITAKMRSVTQQGDIIARLGGDEFGILHRGSVSEESASLLAESLATIVREPLHIGDDVVSISGSLGVALQSKSGESIDALMKRADLALYSAKAKGKAGYAWFEPAMEEKADRYRILRDELSVALERNQLHLEYQPIVSIKTGRIVCCEALLRWRHPIRGLISPAEFIPVAESSGLIDSIERWAFERACRDAATWPDHVRVAVNLSPKQFNSNLPGEFARILENVGVAKDRIELEITETVFLTDSRENVRVLQELKQLGVRLALDDFGTGYSSLAYLRLVSFDKLKIDRSFITDLNMSQDNLAIVRAVIGLGKSFSVTVTAEGVENEQQYDCLDKEGCDQIQGYLISRPLPLASLMTMFGSYRYIE